MWCSHEDVVPAKIPKRMIERVTYEARGGGKEVKRVGRERRREGMERDTEEWRR